jgi:chaperonin GroEL
MSRQDRVVEFDVSARRKMLDGINVLAGAVRVTMGPRGRNVVIEQDHGPPILTKDGVTVAKALNLRDQYPDLGVQLVKEAAGRTAEVAGDGTTTATVLAQALCNEGMRALEAGYDYADLKRGMIWAHTQINDSLQNMSTPVGDSDQISNVALISANGEEDISKIIVEAIEAVGPDGPVTVEEARGFKSSLEVIDGTEIDRGYLSPYFADDQQKMTCTLENPRILIVNKTIETLQEIVPILEKIHSSSSPLLVVADGIEGEALQMLVLNRMKNVLKVCAIASPEFGQGRVNALDDLAFLLGTRVFGAADIDDLKDASIEDLGTCSKVVVHRRRSIFIGTNADGDNIAKRISDLKSQTEDPSVSDDHKNVLLRRVRRLSSGICVLRVGGSTQIELQERKDRVDDALHATRAAVVSGILPGGGSALAKASKGLKVPKNSSGSFRVGSEVVSRACTAPLRQIIENAGGVPDIVIQKVLRSRNPEYGYDARNDKYCNMVESGIIDPTLVATSALENAVSVSVNFLSVGAAMISDETEI